MPGTEEALVNKMCVGSCPQGTFWEDRQIYMSLQFSVIELQQGVYDVEAEKRGTVLAVGLRDRELGFLKVLSQKGKRSSIPQ